MEDAKKLLKGNFDAHRLPTYLKHFKEGGPAKCGKRNANGVWQTPDGSIVMSGGNDDNAKNLKACTGECDNDGQCSTGLKCFHRDNGEPIPGCTGEGSLRF